EEEEKAQEIIAYSRVSAGTRKAPGQSVKTRPIINKTENSPRRHNMPKTEPLGARKGRMAFYRHAFSAFALALLPVLAASAADIAAPPAANRQHVHYILTGLKPLGISQYTVATRSAQREYIHFQNSQGNQYLIYEESPGAPPVAAMKHFREVMGRWEMECRIDMECKMPAFCTGNCKNIYYESSNTPEDLGMLDRNNCTLLSYRCEKPLSAPVQAAIRNKE
ncbi:MAG: hypothetical protein ACXWSL_22185, partial [Bdellovibrionota bacterium]